MAELNPNLEGTMANDSLSIIGRLRGHTDTVYSVAVSPQGSLAATAGLDKSVIVWNLSSGGILKKFDGQQGQGHNGQVLAVAFSPSGEILASCGTDNQIRIWDTPQPWLEPLSGVAGSGPIVRDSKRQMDLRNARNFPHPNIVDALAFDPSGKLVATGCHDGVLRIFDILKAQNVKTITAHVQTQPQQVPHPIYAVAWLPDGKQLLSASYDRTLKLWEVESGKLVREFPGQPDTPPADKPMDKKAEKPEEKKDPPSKDNPAAKVSPAKRRGHRDQVFALALSKDGQRVASCSSDRTVKLWNVATGEIIREFEAPDLTPVFPDEPAPSHPGWVHAVAWTPDQSRLISVGTAPRLSGHLAVWSVSDGRRLAAIETEYPIYSLAVLPDGQRLLLGCGPRQRNEPDAETLLVKLPG